MESLVCCLCFYIYGSEAALAITIIGGHATCASHANYFQSAAVKFAVEVFRQDNQL